MLKLISLIISKIKKEKFVLDENISLGYLLVFINSKFFAYIRFIIKFKTFNLGFIGKNSSIFSSHQIKFGKNLSIDTDQKCGATPEDWISLYDPTIPRITEYLDFPYTFRQTDVPNVFQWIGVGTSLEQQRGKMIKSLKLTPEELKKVEECNTTFPSLWSPENPEPELKPEDQKHTKPEDPTK